MYTGALKLKAIPTPESSLSKKLGGRRRRGEVNSSLWGFPATLNGFLTKKAGGIKTVFLRCNFTFLKLKSSKERMKTWPQRSGDFWFLGFFPSEEVALGLSPQLSVLHWKVRSQY